MNVVETCTKTWLQFGPAILTLKCLSAVDVDIVQRASWV